MQQNNNHPLVEFIYRTFGKSFGDLLLAGYKEERSWEARNIYVVEEVSGLSIEWEIEIAGKSSPIRHDPLVLAALLKLLLHRPSLSSHLEFEISGLVDELGWEDNPLTYKAIDNAISTYVTLFYQKKLSARMRRVNQTGLRWGHYSLVDGYFKVSTGRAIRLQSSQTSRYIDINKEFIQGLKNRQVTFADIYFGPLYPTVKES